MPRSENSRQSLASTDTTHPRNEVEMAEILLANEGSVKRLT